MTSTSMKNEDRCDNCGNRNVEIKRRYKNETYCANCYRIWFIKKPCSKCGNLSRLHKKESFPVCTDCRVSQPCIRCGNDAIKNGANTEYGRVCQICYQGYFRPKKECFECGELKRGVSSYSELPHDYAVCIVCYQSHVRETCPLCRRYRKLVETNKGRICQKCHDFGETPCQTCHQLMPAGMGKQCEECYWSQRLENEKRLNAYLLISDVMRQAYSDFMMWFEAEKGAKTATSKHNHFINFFIRCDELWGRVPSYESLAQEFKPNGLREYLTIVRWLIAAEKISINHDVKDRIAEQERINSLLAKFDDLVPQCINEYYEFLIQRQLERKTTLKSIRMALQPAVDLCVESRLKSSNTPNQEHIDSYLTLKHGQYNSLYGFVRFLNDQYELSLICNKPSEEDIRRFKRKAIEKKIADIFNKPSPLAPKDKLRWLQLGMAYYHQVDVSLNTLKAIPVQPVNQAMSKITLSNKEYWLPNHRQT